MTSDYHAKYFAYELTKRCASDNLEKLSATLSNAQVDLNPHQIEAALFAFRSPLSKGIILADEVGLGKTIEAGLIVSQKWAERKRKILLIVPASLRKQWNDELQEKFFLPPMILETKSFNEAVKNGNLNPFDQNDTIIICSYNFAKTKAAYIKQTKWDLAIIDEAHHLRNVYKSGNKIAKEIKDALKDVSKVLLTATPLQNSLLELFGLVNIIDEHVFGDLASFKANYSRLSLEQDANDHSTDENNPKNQLFLNLRNRLKTLCSRTLRRQVLEYIKFTKRLALTEDYTPSEQEIELYNGMSEYLQRKKLFALPASQRQLISLVLRKLLASSSFAIANTLNNLSHKLDKILLKDEQQKNMRDLGLDNLEQDYENLSELKEEWNDEENEDNTNKEVIYSKEEIELIKKEKNDLEKLCNLAKSIWKNSKGEALIIALKKGFEMAQELGANKKAIIFTESTITQKYLLELLAEHGYKDKTLLFNGSNNNQATKQIYNEWLKKNQNTDKITGSKTADTRAALVDYFKNNAEIMIATEAAAEGVNLQFCSLLVNYDLPWNPQRIEQRIGRCHRYGQKHDVVVINFVNRKNAADQRIYELLDQKFNLFKGVFGASDEILGSIESGVDFEKRIASIYDTCRTTEEINVAFDELQKEMDEKIKNNLSDTRQKLLENFDTEVHEKLKFNEKNSRLFLNAYESWLWKITQHYLKDNADFSDNSYSFTLKNNPFSNEPIDPGPYKIGKNIEDAHIYRPIHPLAQKILSESKLHKCPDAEIIFDYSNNEGIISVLASLVGMSGVLKVSMYTVDAFEIQDAIIFSAIDENENPIDQEIIKKIFQLPTTYISPWEATEEYHRKLAVLEQKYLSTLLSQIEEKNGKFFDDEMTKLDNWAGDKKQSQKTLLKELDHQIKALKKEARSGINLPEKLKIQKQIRDLETKYNIAWKEYDQATKNIEKQKDNLLENVEKQLKQKVEKETLFTIKWKII
jgi:superfamily II DNA/RNA helicase